MFASRLIPSSLYAPRSAWEQLDQMRRTFDRLLEGPLAGQLLRRGGMAGVFPAINLTEDKDHYYVRAELPGQKAAELDIQVVGRNLTIGGERKIAQQENVRYHRRERDAGTFSRIISLPGEIDGDKVRATMVNGILTVTLPKAASSKPRQIAVQ